MEGLHTHLPEVSLGPETLSRCRELWWTLYVLDRHFSSSLGLPMSVRDDEITTLLPGPGTYSHSESSLVLLVQLSRVHTVILSSKLNLQIYPSVPVLMVLTVKQLYTNPSGPTSVTS
jgi:proline utilization trans-activator